LTADVILLAVFTALTNNCMILAGLPLKIDYIFSKRKFQVSTSEKAHARTICLWSNECFTSPVMASQIFLHLVEHCSVSTTAY